MADFCEFVAPTGECQSVVAYIEDIIEAAGAMPRIKYAEDVADPTSDQLDALWEPCTPVACALVVWYNSTTELYQVWSYINSSWRATGTTNRVTPYYTSFEGVGGAVQEGWSGGWILDGEGNVRPAPVLSETELLLNGDMEDWSLATIPDNWVNTGGGTISEENTLVHSGLSSAKLLGAPVTYFGSMTQTVTVTLARWFKFSGWIHTNNTVNNHRIESTSSWLSRTVGVKPSYDRWGKSEVTDFSITTSAVLRVYSIGVGMAGVIYADTCSLQEIVSGWNIQKEFYSPTGTFYIDFTAPGGTHIGILLNYVDINNYTMAVAGILEVGSAAVDIVEVSAGVATVNSTWGFTYVAGARLEVLRDSFNALTIDYNGANLVTSQLLVSPHTSTIHGIVGSSELCSVSAFGYTPE